MFQSAGEQQFSQPPGIERLGCPSELLSLGLILASRQRAVVKPFVLFPKLCHTGEVVPSVVDFFGKFDDFASNSFARVEILRLVSPAGDVPNEE